MNALPRIEARLFGVPLAIEAGKLGEINGVVFGRGDLLARVDGEPMPPPRRAYEIVNGVGVLPIAGTLVKHTRGLAAMSGLQSYDAISRDFRAALADPAVRAILLHIDSRGGEVEGLFDLADEIFAGRGAKPIWAAVDEHAFSAAYAIASAAERVFLPRTGGLGSIGVIGQHRDQSARDALDGYKFSTLFVGKRKNDGNPHEPLSAAARSRFMAELQRVYDLLTVTVARNRGMAEAAIVATDAGLFYGPEAVDAGLADGIATAQEVFSRLAGAVESPALEGALMMQTIQSATAPAAPAPAGNVAAEIIRAAAAAGVPDLAASLIERGATLEVARTQIQAAADNRNEIRAMCELAGQPDRAATFIAQGFSPEQARTTLQAINAAVADASAVSGVRPNDQTHDNPEFLVGCLSDALMARYDAAYQVPDRARQFVGMPLAEMARQLLARRGHRLTSAAPALAIEAALHTTSDFPLLVGDFANKSLRRAYQAAPSGIKAVARQTTAADFKPLRRLAAGEFPQLLEVSELGEFKHGSTSEEGESYQLRTYGRIFGVTRHLLVNDDLRALADTSRRIAVAVAEFEARILADLVNSNPALADGDAVFHANHGNLAGSGAGIDLTTLSAGRQAMRDQKSVDGEVYINVTPAAIVVPSVHETTAEQIVSQVQAATFEDSNEPFRRLSVVVEPRLSGNAWYLAAANGLVDGIEYAYLNAAIGPQVASEAPIDYDGVRVRVLEDFGAGWVDFRGWYKNPGS